LLSSFVSDFPNRRSSLLPLLASVIGDIPEGVAPREVLS
jgi:hypothetical protein